jgi:NAD-dependent DNA ligase
MRDMWRELNNMPSYTRDRMSTIFSSEEIVIEGIKICMTGICYDTGYRVYDRARVFSMIRECGGVPRDSITGDTQLLVIGADPGKTKLDKAVRYGIPRVACEVFMDALQRKHREVMM